MGDERRHRATRREWVGLAVIALPCLLYAMDLTVLFLAAPAIREDLGATSTELLWITDVYGFLLAGLLITMGRLGDRIGRRRLLLWGAVAFGAASVLAACSTSPAMLIAARALLGLAGATLAPSTLALIRNMFADERQRTFAIGVWATSFSVGAAIGPVVGGALLEVFWWGSVFLLAVPVMALLLVVGPRLLPEFRDPAPGRFDLPGAALSLAAVLAVVFGLKEAAAHGAGAMALLALAAGGALGWLFARRQRRAADPLVDVALLRSRRFSAALGSNTLGIFVIGGSDLLLALYLQLVEGFSPLEAGLWTLPSAGGFIAGSMLAPVAVRWVGAPRAVAGGFALTAFGLALWALFVRPGSGFAFLIAGCVVLAVGAAQAVTLGTDLVVTAATPERAGSASAMSETGAELGGALGIALLGSLAAAIYRAEAAEPLAGAPAEARDSLGGAVGVAPSLPPGALDAAQAAFVTGLQVAALTAAVAAALMAAATAVLLRPSAGRAARPPAGAARAQPAPSRC